ncbi:unnamed protein product [Caenorhabditis angaria]|uniref:BED-type domain-containing protein n=1 Tax=Caenorhabditis angaria TaxID=860376 RepID=A0A9P1IJL9_9PELO|nr:unnamed protein product [Caenorhabditis angaria]
MTDLAPQLSSSSSNNNGSSPADDHFVDVSSFTNSNSSNSDSSPPYSSSEHPSPTTDARTPTPNPLLLSYSPENVATSFESSERDHASPDNLSINNDFEKSTGGTLPANLNEELQRQLLRFQQEFKDSMMESNHNSAALNMMSAFNQQLFKSTFGSGITPQLPVSLPAALSITPSPCPTPIVESTPTKRKRQRRNPVWPYFDVVDGTARCKQCLYSTKSVFSTNLKVHLRSHHRADYEKVILAEDALNLNALLLSGNTSKLFNVDANRKRMPPMTSSILMTINKLANQQQNGEENPLNAVLRQTLANNGLQQHLQQVQSQLQAAQVAAAQKQQAQVQAQQQQQQQQIPQFTLNAANLAALNQLARNQVQTPPSTTTTSATTVSQDHIINQLNFPAHIKQEILNAPHGTDANGVPQPKRRRLRRHPVWMFFRDLEDRMVGCINCEFRTGSAFSTNLKMHLKAHHKDDYERVLQLEEEMRLEEGCLGPANKFKSELIDYIRGGGNASTPTPTPQFGSSGVTNSSGVAPKASPLVQQIISQKLLVNNKKELSDEDSYSGMSTTDKLAALVGIGEKSSETSGAPASFEELRQAAERLFAANNFGGLLAPAPPQIVTPSVDLNGSIIASETKSTCSSSTSNDVEIERKQERDKALARLWSDNETLLTNIHFREFIHTLAPEYEIPDAEILASQLSDQE